MDTSKPKPTTLKRPHTEVSSDPDSDLDIEPTQTQSTSEWPRFLVLESQDKDRPLTKLSPFAIAKCIQGLAGEPKSLKKLNSGQLLVECNKRAHAVNLLSVTSFINIPVTVSAHRTMNSCKGVVRSRDLEGTTDDEMVKNLKTQGVVDAKRIFVRKGEVRVATNTYVLTFNTPTLPQYIKAGFISIPVEHYIPNPLRCFKCQRFGHHKDKCRREAVCGRCGQSDHDDSSSCTRPAVCVNCNGSHTAFDRNCSKWIAEKEVQRVKTVNGLSFPEARKLVESRAPACTLGQTYASVAKVVEQAKPTRSVETQTDITWPVNKTNFITISKQNPSTNSSQPKSSSTQTVDKELPLPKNSSSPRKEGKKEKKAQSNRQAKGSTDPIQQHNRYGALAEMDTSEVSRVQRPKPEPASKPNIVRLSSNPP